MVGRKAGSGAQGVSDPTLAEARGPRSPGRFDLDCVTFIIFLHAEGWVLRLKRKRGGISSVEDLCSWWDLGLEQRVSSCTGNPGELLLCGPS